MLVLKNSVNSVIKKLFVLIIAAFLVFLSMPKILSLAADSKVTYSGKGTKADPYLVTTDKQLDGMRNNLSAHYKLAATIDMSKFGDFEPIGYLAQPFTGSFTCDLAEDGLPYYAIKNLTVNNKRGAINKHAAGTANFPDYKEKNSHWETALFGATTGANLSGIYLLNANITSTIVGELSYTYPNGTDKPYVNCPGTAEQGTATLVAIADSTTIKNCGATGSVQSKSNYTGGLIGYMKNNSNVVNSYCEANVQTSGCWDAGGLVAYIEGSNAQSCYATGRVDAPMKKSFNNDRLNLTGGFAGQIHETSVVSDCYATGSVTSNGYSFAPVGDSNAACVMNCYATGKADSISTPPVGNESTTTCLVLADVGCVQPKFNAASSDLINATFASLKGWQAVEGKLPQLKDVKNVSDESIFVVGADRAGITPPKNSVAAGDPALEESTESSADEGATVTADDGNTTASSGNATLEKKIFIAVLAVLVFAISALTTFVLLFILLKKLPKRAD